MPKKQIIGCIIILVILSFVCIYIYDNFKIDIETSLIVESENDNNEIVEYYISKNDNYYLYNIDNIIVDYTDRTLNLNRALELKQITIKEVKKYLSKKYSLNNGTVNFYQNEDFSLLECSFSNGKTNYIFGNKVMDYKEELCNEEPYVCSFIKTYLVLDVSEIKNSKNMYVTLKNQQSSEVSTIELNKEIASNLEINKYYKFKFASTDDRIDENIKNIFDNNRILEYSDVTEEKNNVNDNICK